MSLKKILLNMSCFAVVLSGMAGGCKKKEYVVDADDNAAYGRDAARLEQAFSDVQYIVDESADTLVFIGADIVPAPSSSCATVTNNRNVTPHRMVVDFGPVDCDCNDGRTRRGQIIVTYTGKYRDSGHVRTITFKDYYVDDNQVIGTQTVTNMGHNAYGDRFVKVSAEGSIVYANNGGAIGGAWEQTRTMTEGEASATSRDDRYELRGSGTVTRANGRSFKTRILSPVLVQPGCRWITGGVVEITPEQGIQRTLEYGDGSNCDGKLIVNVGGKDHEVTFE